MAQGLSQPLYFHEILSDQQYQIYILFYLRRESKESIARALGIKPQQIDVQLRRIDKKREQSDLPEREDLLELIAAMNPENSTPDDVADAFAADITRVGGKYTNAQARYYASLDRMYSKDQKYKFKRRIEEQGIKKPKERGMKPDWDYRGQLSAEELAEHNSRPVRTPLYSRDKLPPTWVSNLHRQYIEGEMQRGGRGHTQRMAEIEVVLRAFGVIYRTPYINKLNRSTGKIMRAGEVYIVRAGHDTVTAPVHVPDGAKLVEVYYEDDLDTGAKGKVEYRVYVI